VYLNQSYHPKWETHCAEYQEDTNSCVEELIIVTSSKETEWQREFASQWRMKQYVLSYKKVVKCENNKNTEHKQHHCKSNNNFSVLTEDVFGSMQTM
jgi:hypothetical protein